MMKVIEVEDMDINIGSIGRHKYDKKRRYTKEPNLIL